MKVVYAPSFRGSMDDLHTNVVCGFEIMALEVLCEIAGSEGEVLYFPHAQTPKIYHKTSKAIISNPQTTFVCK